eukprot:15438351-Alexandrium_andersonii.AAC.1
MQSSVGFCGFLRSSPGGLPPRRGARRKTAETRRKNCILQFSAAFCAVPRKLLHPSSGPRGSLGAVVAPTCKLHRALPS